MHSIRSTFVLIILTFTMLFGVGLFAASSQARAMALSYTPTRDAADHQLAVSTTTATRTLSRAPTPSLRSERSKRSRPVVGINVGSAIAWELPYTQTLGAKNVRMDFSITTPISVMDPIIAAYAQAGIRAELLATFDGTIPKASVIANLAVWARRYGPKGTFWSQFGYSSALAVTRIEFGNESSGYWEYPALAHDSDWWSSPIYARIARNYGRAYLQAIADVRTANSRVKVLAVADSSDQAPEWLDNMFTAAPKLAQAVEGWVIHPYGDEWRADINTTLRQTESLGASTAVPVYVTEVGIATDNGRCLNGNYGWNTCMSYQQAATTITRQAHGIVADLGRRLAELAFYSAGDIVPTGTSTDMEDYFGALQSNGQPKGAYTSAIERLLATSSN